MNGILRKPNYRVVVRLVAVLACGLGPSMAWSPWAQAAGNVQASVADGNLIIAGDTASNNILVIQEFNEVVTVVGRAGTTVNGERGPSSADGVTNIAIDMRGGDDFVRVEVVPSAGLAIPGDLRIDTGKRNDIIELLGVTVAAETRIDTGDGSDTIFIDGVFTPSEEFCQVGLCRQICRGNR